MKKLIIILTIFLSFQQSNTVEVVELKFMNNWKFFVDNQKLFKQLYGQYIKCMSKTKQKVGTVMPNLKECDVQQAQFICIAGGEEGRGRGGGYLCNATPSPSPSPVTHAQTACLLSIRPFCAIVFLYLVLYFVSYSVLIPFTSNTFQQFSFNLLFPYLK